MQNMKAFTHSDGHVSYHMKLDHAFWYDLDFLNGNWWLCGPYGSMIKIPEAEARLYHDGLVLPVHRREWL